MVELSKCPFLIRDPGHLAPRIISPYYLAVAAFGQSVPELSHLQGSVLDIYIPEPRSHLRNGQIPSQRDPQQRGPTVEGHI